MEYISDTQPYKDGKKKAGGRRKSQTNLAFEY